MGRSRAPRAYDAVVPLPSAAGGILYRRRGNQVEVCLVHRKQHGDWALPKGKPQEGEADWRAVALRGVKEETGWVGQAESFAGVLTHTVDGRLKVVAYWLMRGVRREGEQKDRAEIDDVQWMSLGDALQRLSHEKQRELLCRAFKRDEWAAWARGDRARILTRIQIARGEVRMQIASEEVRMQIATPLGKDGVAMPAAPPTDPPWGLHAMALLDLAEQAARSKAIDEAWQLVASADRMRIYGMSDTEIANHRSMLLHEAHSKLRSWRRASAKALLHDKTPNQSALYLATLTRDEHHHNVYRQQALVRSQLLWFSIALVIGLLGFALLTLWLPDPFDPIKDQTQFAAYVVVTGLIGASTSAIRSAASSRTRTPELISNGYVSLARLLIGVVSALIVYATVRAGVIKVFDPKEGAGFILLAFASGFSERLLMSALDKMGAGETADRPPVDDDPQRAEGPEQKRVDQLGQAGRAVHANDHAGGTEQQEVAAPADAEGRDRDTDHTRHG